jgi:hypothetical protein
VVTTRRATGLLQAPSFDAPRVASVPRNTALDGLARTRDGRWLKVSYGGQIGWVNAFAGEPGNGCDDLPIER